MAGKVKIPGMGEAYHPGTDEEIAHHQKVIDARHKFVVDYCRKKGWPAPEDPEFKSLGIDKIMEIRDQEGWKNPLGEDDDPDVVAMGDPDAEMTIVPKGRN